MTVLCLLSPGGLGWGDRERERDKVHSLCTEYSVTVLGKGLCLLSPHVDALLVREGKAGEYDSAYFPRSTSLLMLVPPSFFVIILGRVCYILLYKGLLPLLLYSTTSLHFTTSKTNIKTNQNVHPHPHQQVPRPLSYRIRPRNQETLNQQVPRPLSHRVWSSFQLL